MKVNLYKIEVVEGLMKECVLGVVRVAASPQCEGGPGVRYGKLGMREEQEMRVVVTRHRGHRWCHCHRAGGK